MTADAASGQRAFVRYVLLPQVLLTVTLLGGVRLVGKDASLVFLPPPLITLILALLLVALLARGGIVGAHVGFSADFPPLANVSHALTLVALLAASAQALSAVLPERGAAAWLFRAFLLWSLWQALFLPFQAPQLLRSLLALFGTAFVVKHVLLAALHEPEAGWAQRVLGALFEGAPVLTQDAQAFAPATGYVAFATLVLYGLALVLLAPPRAPSSSVALAVRDDAA